jgi:aryl-alcohol dehydrogenase-like predicted oxidoreductase
MRQVKFGNTGLFVSELCLGTMTFGGEGFWRAIGTLGQAEADSMIARATEAGINFFDTADVYSQGRSEALLGQAVRNLGLARGDLVIATKAFGEMGAGANARGMSRYHLMDAIQASLKRLQMDYVDLYQIHGFDPATPIEEAVRALDQLVRDGRVRYLGVSNWAAWQIAKALGIADRLGLARFDSLQAYYTVEGRDLERELVPFLRSEGLALMVWSPLAGGLLTGKYQRGQAAEGGSRRNEFDFPPVDRERVFRCVDVMREMAQQREASVAQIAVAWLLHQPVVTSVIIGAKRIEQLDDNIGATRIRLTAEELERLAAVAPPPAEYPGWMLDRMGAFRRDQLRDSRIQA